MTWLIVTGWIVGSIAGLIVLIMIVGWFLPEKYQARIQMKFQRTPEDVWGAMSDFRKHPMTGSMSKRIEELPPQNGLPAWIEDMGSSQIVVTTVVSEVPTCLVRDLADRVVPMTVRGEVRVERTGEGCQVTASNETRVRSGTWHVPIFRFILTVTNGTRRSLVDYWKAIAKDLGEPVRIQ